MEKLTFENYLDWHRKTVGDDLGAPDLRAKFDANMIVLRSTVNTHPLTASVLKRITALSDLGLFQGSSKPPELLFNTKPFDSLVNKFYRLNCHWNRRWPQAPQGGWISYSTCFDRIDDLVRTILVCKYLDGPERVSEEVRVAAGEVGLDASASPRATDTGYYAWHGYVRMPAQVIMADRVTDISLSVEFQVITQFQAALRELTHRFYEQDRSESAVARSQARWDYQSLRFRAEYLGHTLHLVDAMLLELRQAQEAESPTTGEVSKSVEGDQPK